MTCFKIPTIRNLCLLTKSVFSIVISEKFKITSNYLNGYPVIYRGYLDEIVENTELVLKEF